MPAKNHKNGDVSFVEDAACKVAGLKASEVTKVRYVIFIVMDIARLV